MDELKRGNADELAFLEELAGVPSQSNDATKEIRTEAEHKSPSAGVDVQATSQIAGALRLLQQGNADELSFLDELAGIAPSQDVKPEDDATQQVTFEATEAAGHPAPGQAAEAVPTTTAATAEATDAADKEDQEPGEDETYERDATELLDAFKDVKQEQDAREDADIFKDFLSELRSVDKDNEVNRILWAFKLNPFEKMNLQFTATEADVRKQYRKISLLIHPDKCAHPQASEAFEILQQAQKELLDEEVRTSLLRVLEFARERVRKERRKATKHDSAMRLATILHDKGREGVEEAWEQTDDFFEKWKLASRDVLAKAEFRKRKLNKRVKEEEERITAEEKQEAQERKKARKDRKEWLDKRTDRITSWRDWNAGKGTKKIGGVKAPKIKAADAERSYVQRATTEQFIGNYRKKAPK